MSANSTFQPVREHGWRRGFINLLRHENELWWRTNRWWINILIWLVLINGIVLATLATPETSASGASATTAQTVATATVNFATIATLFGAIGIIIIMQGVIIDEKKSGTAAWIASKPTSRAAFVLSKLVANVVASLVIIVLIQGGIAYLQFTLRGNAPPLGPFLWGLALMSLHLLFYLTLTLMLGTLFNERGAVIAIPLVVLFSAQFVMGLSPSLTMYTPWPLLFPTAIGDPLPIQAMTGQTLTTVTPIVATIVWIVVFVGVAIWRFEREEF